jgi:hypothetical protein
VLLCGVLFLCVSGTPLGLMQDSSSGSMLLWSGDALHEVSLSNEGKDMWRTYLDYQVRAQATCVGGPLDMKQGMACTVGGCMLACMDDGLSKGVYVDDLPQLPGEGTCNLQCGACVRKSRTAQPVLLAACLPAITEGVC